MAFPTIVLRPRQACSRLCSTTAKGMLVKPATSLGAAPRCTGTMCACMRARAHVCRPVRMYAGPCACMRARVHACRPVRMYAGPCACMQARAHVCRPVCMYAGPCACACINCTEAPCWQRSSGGPVHSVAQVHACAHGCAQMAVPCTQPRLVCVCVCVRVFVHIKHHQGAPASWPTGPGLCVYLCA